MNAADPHVELLPSAGLYWKRERPSPVGALTRDEIFLEVGRALSAWESIEEKCGRIFFQLTRWFLCGEEQKYVHVQTTRLRRDLLGDAGGVYFELCPAAAGLASPFRTLLDHYSGGAARRNEIAHGVVSPPAEETGEFGYFLVPGETNSVKNYRYTGKDIAAIRCKLEALDGAFGQFMRDLERMMSGTRG